MTDILSVTSLSVAYGKIEAVHDVSLAIKSGQIVTVIGPNGAGKTSLLGAIAGLVPARGNVSFDGRNLARLDVEDRVECGICIVPERRELFGTMSVGDNLLLGAYTRRSKKAEVHRTLEEVFEIFPRLAERRKQLAEKFSGGEQQMLALGRGLMTRPRLMLLDEPSLGLAPLIVRDIFKSSRRCANPVCPFCWSNRTPGLRSRQLTMRMCSKQVRSGWRGRRPP